MNPNINNECSMDPRQLFNNFDEIVYSGLLLHSTAVINLFSKY